MTQMTSANFWDMLTKRMNKKIVVAIKPIFLLTRVQLEMAVREEQVMRRQPA